MLSVAELAERDQVSKPNVSRRVKQLRELGLQVELDAQGRVAAVNSVQYDELRGRHDDPSKAQAPARTAGLPVNGESYEEALRQKTWIEAERSRLQLAAAQGKVVPVDELADALSVAGERIVRAVDLLLNDGDDLAAAVAKEGVAGLRGHLKKIVHRMRGEIADALSAIAAEHDET